MRKSLALGAAFLGATMAFAPAAMALSPKTFVSATGNDANTATNCSKNDPCRGFAAAYSVTNTGGIIVAIDTGVYGQLTITKAVTLTAAPGVTAEVLVPSGQSGFTVSAGASDVVVLQNLKIFGTVGPTTGINHTSGKLVVIGSTFSGLTVGINAVLKTDTIDSNFVGNGVGMQVTGPGCANTGPPTCSTTVARVHGGNFVNNGSALASVDATTDKTPFMLHIGGSSSDMSTNFAGNTNLITAGGGSPGGLFVVAYGGVTNPN